MANTKNPQHFFDGIKLVPEATPTLSEEGTLKYDSAAGKAKIRGGAGTETLVTEDKAATLTNKTIDGDDNTVQDLPLTAIKTVVGDASKFLVRDASGIPTSSNTVPSGTVVGTTDTQTLTGKTIVVASNTITTAASGNLAATELDSALAELQTDIDTRALDSALTTHVADTTTHGTTGNVVGTSDSQTLTNKTISTEDNTIESGAAGAGQVFTADGAGGTEWSDPETAPSSSVDINNLTLAASVSAGAITIDLKTAAGNDPSAGDPVKISFRSATATSGLYEQVEVDAATTFTLSSGSSLGLTNTTDDIYVFAINNAGDVELAVSSNSYIAEAGLINTTAEGGAGAADINFQIYSTTARTGLAYRLIGRIRANHTSGVWSSISEIALQPIPPVMAKMGRYELGAGYGVTNTKIRRFNTTAFDSVLTAISWTVSDNNLTGGLITINRSGVYGLSYMDNFSAAADLGISKNSTELTTAISSITRNDRLAVSTTTAANKPDSLTWVGFLRAGDLIRCHNEGTTVGTGPNSVITITRIS